MSHQTKDSEDQADELRKIFLELEHSDAPDPAEKEVYESHPREDEIDLLNLPPRKEIHNKSQKRAKLKFSRSLLRLTIVIVLILCILAGVYFAG
ncbi:hypothetical protein [Oceanobacillus kapialis]|uniref:Uncharacterized protein n=1 Tax=Oceanobacillus kapialis TaxID=481353 RepID=A0ABW5Q5F7_9BACI